MTTLREAAQQALEALENEHNSPRGYGYELSVYEARETSAAITALRAALAQPAEPVEPVAWLYQNMYTEQEYLVWKKGTGGRNWTPLYTAPPQRQPLTDEEILKAIGWERAEMYMKLTPNFPVAEAKKETLKNARAIERAHGIGEQP